jgi:hypothetical protein
MTEEHAAAYDQRLKDNLSILTDENTLHNYPSLSRLLAYRKGIYKRRLEAIITDCLNTKNRERILYSKGAESVFISSRHLARQHPDLGSHYTTWSSAINFLSFIGLIQVKHPTAETAITTREKKAVKRAGLYEKKAATPADTTPITHAISFIWVETYTIQQLDYMNDMAQKWFVSGR